MTDLITNERAEELLALDGFTQGPWTTNQTVIQGAAYGGLWVEGAEHIRISGSGGLRSYTKEVVCTQLNDDNDANARLIAAAPELLTLARQERAARIAAEAERDRLRGDLRLMVLYAEQDDWGESNTGRHAVIAAARTALKEDEA